MNRLLTAIVFASTVALLSLAHAQAPAAASAAAAETAEQALQRQFRELKWMPPGSSGSIDGKAQFKASAAYTFLERGDTDKFLQLNGEMSQALMQKLVAWELSDPSPQVRRLSDQRAMALGDLVARLRGDRQPTAGLDAPALNAILIAGVQHLVLAGATSGRFSGMALASDADWDRAKAMLTRIIRALNATS